MLNVAAVDRVCLARGSTDLRKSIDGLAILVKEEFDLDPFSLVRGNSDLVPTNKEQGPLSFSPCTKFS
jgi:hypothetical protein